MERQRIGDYSEDIARAMWDDANGSIEILHVNGNVTFQLPVGYLAPPPQSGSGGIGGASRALHILINSTAAGTDAGFNHASRIRPSINNIAVVGD